MKGKKKINNSKHPQPLCGQKPAPKFRDKLAKLFQSWIMASNSKNTAMKSPRHKVVEIKAAMRAGGICPSYLQFVVLENPVFSPTSAGGRARSARVCSSPPAEEHPCPPGTFPALPTQLHTHTHTRPRAVHNQNLVFANQSITSSFQPSSSSVCISLSHNSNLGQPSPGKSA